MPQVGDVDRGEPGIQALGLERKRGLQLGGELGPQGGYGARVLVRARAEQLEPVHVFGPIARILIEIGIGDRAAGRGWR